MIAISRIQSQNTSPATSELVRRDGAGVSIPDVTQAADVSSNSTTGVNTDLTFEATANTNYLIIFVGSAIATTAGNTMQISLILPSGGSVHGSIQANASVFSLSGAANGVFAGPMTGSIPNTVATSFTAYGLIRIGSTGGTVQMQIRRSAGTGIVTLQAGSALLYQAL